MSSSAEAMALGGEQCPGNERSQFMTYEELVLNPSQFSSAKKGTDLCTEFCTKSGEDISKFAFRDITNIDNWNGPLATKIGATNKMLVLQTNQLTEMKEANIIAPYTFRKEQEEAQFLFVLNYITTEGCLPQMAQLRRASTLPSADQTMMIHAIVHSRQARVNFDTSWLEDLYERIVMESEGDRITPLVTNPGRVMLTTARLYFQPFNNVEPFPVLKIKLTDIKRVIKRRFLLRHVGIEIYSGSRLCPHLYLSLKSTVDRNQLYDHILSQPGLRLEDMGTENMTLKWQNGVISNYDYLIYLNSMADRSTNDLTQYPVFPWVIADYTSTSLDFNSSSTFRDLSKPIGALSADRLQKLLDRCQDMPDPKFLYGSHYSTPGFVLFYLARVAPEHVLCLQNGRFDHPDRMFNSLFDAWQNCMTSFSDFKELIPEFYTGSGNFLKANPDINFGTRHNGKMVSAVELPPWADSTEDLISKMRQGLESEYVSQNLHSWIDLIFGYKQQGEEAQKANNLYYYLTYEGAVDLESIEDPNQRAALEAQIMEFGQTPKQLFQTPHPRRQVPPPVVGQTQTSHDHRDMNTETDSMIEVGEKNVGVSSTKSCSDTKRDYEGLKPHLRHKLHKDAILDIRWGPKGESVYSVSKDNTLKVYSVGTQSQLRSVHVSSMPLSSLILIKDASVAILGCWDNNIYVYSLEFGRMLEAVYAHDDAVSCLCCRGTLLVSSSQDSFAKLWQIVNCERSKSKIQLELQAELEHESGVLSLCLDSNGKMLLSGTQEGRVYVWDLQSQTPLHYLHSHSGPVCGLALSPEEDRAISCGEDGYIRVMDVKTGTEIFNQCTEASLRCVAWAGGNVLTGNDKGQLLVWDMVSVSLCKNIQCNHGAVTCINITESGQVVTASDDQSVLIWTLEDM